MKSTAECHCGALRVLAQGEPDWVNLCHCRACQRRTGTIVHAGAYFDCTRLQIDGVSRIYQRPADSGYEMSFHFCPDCGSNVYWVASRFPRHYGIAVGAFADPDFQMPSFSVWQESMHRWLHLPAGVGQFRRGRIGVPLGVQDALLVVAPQASRRTG